MKARTSRTEKYDVLERQANAKVSVRGSGERAGLRVSQGQRRSSPESILTKEKEGEIYGSAHWPNLTYTLP